jgi:hypothetical protein
MTRTTRRSRASRFARDELLFLEAIDDAGELLTVTIIFRRSRRRQPPA